MGSMLRGHNDYLSPCYSRHSYELPGPGGAHMYGSVLEPPPMYEDADKQQGPLYEVAGARRSVSPLYSDVDDGAEEVYGLTGEQPPEYEVASDDNVKLHPIMYDALNQPKQASIGHVITPDSTHCPQAVCEAKSTAFADTEPLYDNSPAARVQASPDQPRRPTQYERPTFIENLLYDNSFSVSSHRSPTRDECTSLDDEPVYERPRGHLSITSEGQYCFEFNDVDGVRDVHDQAFLPRLMENGPSEALYDHAILAATTEVATYSRATDVDEPIYDVATSPSGGRSL